MVNIAEEKSIRQDVRNYLACGRSLGAAVWVRGVTGDGVREGTGGGGERVKSQKGRSVQGARADGAQRKWSAFKQLGWQSCPVCGIKRKSW